MRQLVKSPMAVACVSSNSLACSQIVDSFWVGRCDKANLVIENAEQVIEVLGTTTVARRFHQLGSRLDCLVAHFDGGKMNGVQ